MKDLNLKKPKDEKLLLTLQTKHKYIVHFRNLQFYLKEGVKLRRVSRVLEFEQEPWMKSYIEMNAEFTKQAKD